MVPWCLCICDTRVVKNVHCTLGAHAQRGLLCVCVCVCVQASHPLLTQLQDQVDIPMDSVSCSLQNKFGVFRIMA